MEGKRRDASREVLGDGFLQLEINEPKPRQSMSLLLNKT